MASITIRRLDEDVKTKLRVRAASHGRSMEEEAREILRAELGAKSVRQANLAESIRRYVEPFGGAWTRHTTAREDSPPCELLQVILLDTNVISEVFKPVPSGAVLR